MSTKLINVFYSYYTTLEAFCLTVEYNFNLNFLTINKYTTSIELYEYSKNYKNMVNDSLYKDLLASASIIDSIYSSSWFNSFTEFLDKTSPLSKQASILDSSFIELQRNSNNDYLLGNGSWVLTDSSLLEMTILVFQAIIEAIALIYLFFVAYLLTSATYISFRKDSVDHDHFVCAGSIQSEKEIGNIDDLMNTALILVFLFSCYANQLLCSYILSYLPIPELVLTGFLLFFATLFLNLLMLLWDLGSLFIIFIKGSSRKTSFLYELFLDILFIFSYFVRTLIQNVRVAVTFIFYFSYMHALEDQYPEVYSTSLAPSIRDVLNPSTSNYQLIKDFSFNAMHVIYEAAHFSVILLSQLASFLMIVFWIFNSLYFAYEENTSERLLAIKRREYRDFNPFN